MDKTIQGNVGFRNHYVPAHKALFEKLVLGQQPPILLITCSDSRVSPNTMTETEPGHLFVIRNAGNMFPPNPYYPSPRKNLEPTIVGVEVGTAEYAVESLSAT